MASKAAPPDVTFQLRYGVALAHDAWVLTLMAASGRSGVDVVVLATVVLVDGVDVEGELELLELLELELLLDEGGTDDEVLLELELEVLLELLELELLDDGGSDDELLGVELELELLDDGGSDDELLGVELELLLELTATDDDVAVAPSRSAAPATGPANTPMPAKASPNPAITPPTLVTRSMATLPPFLSHVVRL
jgi:hypothetical protein